jgi:N-acetylglucosaminyldiphosphoundecaprenol N-acetyl-beta-D-mannosaminyltransferase
VRPTGDMGWGGGVGASGARGGGVGASSVRGGGVGASSAPEGPAVPPLGGELGERYHAQKRDFLGIGLSCLPDEAFLDAVRQAVETRSRLTVSFINPDYVLRGHKTPGLIDKMNRFDIVLPDGWGIVLGGRRLGLPVPDRQGNDDICPKIFALSAERGFSNFLFGCSEGTPEKAAANLTSSFPGLPIAGGLHGYWDVVRGHPGRYDDDDDDMMVETINAANADILHVSIPTPMQQTWVWQVGSRLNVPVIITGGSYLDHLAERVYWYPGWVNKMRLGWAYRLTREPGRLWKRYSLDLMRYGGMVLRAKLGRANRAPG